ncbi:MAG: phosphate acyltransferase PlsX [Actinobacteria bacterium]|nr:phosphate acyltransferase PlsX [Actinomycetota bacterium]MCL5887018.1 phosphate acyltransferase PlsX [Actinomycetota bacterium]
MSDLRIVTVAVDAVGGDFAPSAILEGVHRALAGDTGLRVCLLGPEEIVVEHARKSERCDAVITTQTIDMDENPVNAVRTKRDSSIVVGCRMVKETSADAFFSAGSTGACMAAATLTLGRIKGISRPAIATVIPTERNPVVLLDVGANADCKPEYLLDFARMGQAYARLALGVGNPRIGLLNIGEEPSKGSQLSIDAHGMLRESVPGFVGNIEGRDLTQGAVDVVVTDGFTGNVTLKLLEGVSKSLLTQVKAAMLSSVATKAAAVVLKPSLMRLKEKMSPDTYGGAPLLGVNGVCIIGHGSSSPLAVSNAIAMSAQMVRRGLLAEIARATAAQDVSDSESGR